MRVGSSVLRPNGQPCVIAALAAVNCILNSRLWTAVLAAALAVPALEPARAENLPEALVRTYQGNPALNAERARLREPTRPCRRRSRATGRRSSPA